MALTGLGLASAGYQIAGETRDRRRTHLIAARAGHHLHFDDPDFVVCAIRDILQRQGRAEGLTGCDAGPGGQSTAAAGSHQTRRGRSLSRCPGRPMTLNPTWTGGPVPSQSREEIVGLYRRAWWQDYRDRVEHTAQQGGQVDW